MVTIKIISTILLLLSSFSLNLKAQNVKEVLSKMHENYAKSKTFSVDMDYTLFKGKHSGIVSEQYKGKIASASDGQYQKIDQVEMITTEKYALMLDHSSQQITYSHPVERDFLSSVNQALESASNKKLSEKKNVFVIDLEYNGRNNSNLNRVIIKLFKNTYRIKSVDLLYANRVDFSENYGQNDYAYPHLRISYSNYRTNSNLLDSALDVSNYLKIEGDENQGAGVHRRGGNRVGGRIR